MRDLGIAWPVVQDNAYALWNAYGNRYWPAKYFIDARGRVRYFHFGEGSYAESERVIRALLEEAGATRGRQPFRARDERLSSRTPETYLGHLRGAGPVGRPGCGRGIRPSTVPPADPGNGEWTLEGRWTIAGEYAATETTGVLELGFHARDVFLVIEPEGPGGTLEVLVDGMRAADTADVRGGVLAPSESRLYHLVRLEAAGPHVLRLAVKGRLRLFAFTFG